MTMPTKSRVQDFTFEITNPWIGAVTQQFNLLGAAYNGQDISSAGGDPGGAIITVPESSTEQVQRENLNNDILIKAMKINVSDERQLQQPFFVVSKDMAGQLLRLPINFSRYINPLNAQTKLIILNESTGFTPIKVWSDVGFEGSILPYVTMDILVTFEYVYRSYDHYVQHLKFIDFFRNLFKTKNKIA